MFKCIVWFGLSYNLESNSSVIQSVLCPCEGKHHLVCEICHLFCDFFEGSFFVSFGERSSQNSQVIYLRVG